MSNRRHPKSAPPAGGSLLLCPDCNSTVHEVWYGKAPQLILSIEVEHSDSCPAWREDGREVVATFLPKDGAA